jgi:5-methylcytosine-specific restriction enzyme A
MNEFEGLKAGDKLTNDGLRSIFKCATQGGMRKSNTTNTLVLVSDQTRNSDENPYNDKWIGEEFHYTGMGLRGDQSVSFRQNKTLANLKQTNTRAFLFEKNVGNCYVFIGEVFLNREIYYEPQEDSEGKERKVVKFPLKVKE